MQIIKAVFCLLCGASALALAQEFDWDNLDQSGVGRYGKQRPHQPEMQEPAAVHQEKQYFSEPLSWRYPDPPPEEEPQFPPDFELKPPAAPDSVSVVCGESTVLVEAKKDLLGLGKPVHTADITLGGCLATAEDAEVMIFESELHGCGSQLLMSEESFVYAFTLLYTPRPLAGSPIIRGTEVSVSIQCHYQRKQNVTGGILKPSLNPFDGIKASEENLYFSFRLMTDDWQFARPSSQFLLGDMLKFEVSVKQFHHTPLRVTVDSCVATVIPNVDTVPRYVFLENSGCLFDSKLTDSSSRFLPRSQDDKLQFEIEAFRFQHEDSGIIYITCALRATAASAAVDPTNKACYFFNGWREASGSHDACSCCDTDCGSQSQNLLTETGPGVGWTQENAVGPITVKERAADTK